MATDLVLVNGPAAGAGMSLAISGDMVLCTSTAHFTPAYSSLALTPDGGMSWLLPRLVGMRRAQEILLLNRKIAAEEARTIGLVTQVVEREELTARGLELAVRLAEAPGTALGSTRKLLQHSLQAELSEQLALEEMEIVRAGSSTACAKAMTDYFRKAQRR